jgi:hypothetical protein
MQKEKDLAVNHDVDPTELPENAFRELKNGEEYGPVMHPERNYAEATPYSVTMGLLLAVIFSASLKRAKNLINGCLIKVGNKNQNARTAKQ